MNQGSSDSQDEGSGSRQRPALTAIAQFFQGTLLLDQLRLRLAKLGACPLQQRLCPQAWEGEGKGEEDGRGMSVTPPSGPHLPQTPPPLSSSNPGPSPARSTRESHSSYCRLGPPGSKHPAPPSAPRLERSPPAPQTLQVTSGDSQDTLPRFGTSPRDRGVPTDPLPCLQGPKPSGPHTRGPTSSRSARTVCPQQVLVAKQRPSLYGGCGEKALAGGARGLRNCPLARGVQGPPSWDARKGRAGIQRTRCAHTQGRQTDGDMHTHLCAHRHTHAGAHSPKTGTNSVHTRSHSDPGRGCVLRQRETEGRSMTPGWLNTTSPHYVVTHL